MQVPPQGPQPEQASTPPCPEHPQAAAGTNLQALCSDTVFDSLSQQQLDEMPPHVVVGLHSKGASPHGQQAGPGGGFRPQTKGVREKGQRETERIKGCQGESDRKDRGVERQTLRGARDKVLVDKQSGARELSVAASCASCRELGYEACMLCSLFRAEDFVQRDAAVLETEAVGHEEVCLLKLVHCKEN